METNTTEEIGFGHEVRAFNGKESYESGKSVLESEGYRITKTIERNNYFIVFIVKT